MRHLISLLLYALGAAAAFPLAAAAESDLPLSSEQARDWVQEMKTAPRGPFARIRWFCNDGTVLPPKAYACSKHGGGHQHGEWSERTRRLRANGYLIANILAGTDGGEFLAQPDAAEAYAQILLEQFLINQDDGWILRKARFYRGAFQVEDETAGAQALLRAMLADPHWQGRGFLALRTGAGLLPWQEDAASVSEVRQESSALANQVPKFLSLKNKIHNRPDAGDAKRVRDFATNVKDPAMAKRFEALAIAIDEIYQADGLSETLASMRKSLPADSSLGKRLARADEALTKGDAQARHRASAGLLAELRDAIPGLKGSKARLDALRLSLELELVHFRATTELEEILPELSRAERLSLLDNGLTALYGVGLLSTRQLQAARAELDGLRDKGLQAGDYKRGLDYVAHVPAWASRHFSFHFGEAVERWKAIEPLSDLFSQDHLRGSPLLFYSKVIDGLLVDANQLLGVKHVLFGDTLGGGLRALNPGLAR